MFWIRTVKLPQKLDPIHILGDPSSNVVIAIKANSTIRNGFRGLTVRSRHDNAVRLESFLELCKEPRGRSETTDEPDGFDHTSREGDLVPDGGDRSFYRGFEQLGNFIAKDEWSERKPTLDRIRSYPVSLSFPPRIPTLGSLSRGLPKWRN